MRVQSANLVMLLLLSAAPALAQQPGEPRPSEDDSEEAPPPPPPPRVVLPSYRYPEGSFSVSGGLGVVSSSSQGTVFEFGLGLGYAVLTGVVPGIRGELVTTSQIAGEVAVGLTLTPPLALSFVPFGLAEVGQRWDMYGSAHLYGFGAGIILGEPESHFGVQLGWAWHRYDYGGLIGTVDTNGPLIGLAVRL
jgi:hypothetical protein